MAQDRTTSDKATSESVQAEGFGAQLQAAREAEGISLGDMAVRSRLSVAQLRALESEDMSALPEPVYVRAFIRGCAHCLGLDGQALVDDYVRRFGGRGDQLSSGVLPLGDPGVEPVLNAAPRHRGLKLAVLFVGILVVAAGIAAVYSDQFGAAKTDSEAMKIELGVSENTLENDQPQPPAAANAENETAAAPAVDATAEKAVEKTPEKTPEKAPAAASVPQPAAAAEAASAPIEPKATAAGAVEAASAPQAAAPALERQIEFVISQPVWVQVITPEGRNVVAREMRPGDDVTVKAPVGSRFTIGNGEAASLRVDGQPFDLVPATRNGIARFTLQ